MAAPTPIKQFEMHSESMWRTMKYSVHQNGQVILHVDTKSSWRDGPRVELTLPDSSLLAVCKSKAKGWSDNMYLVLGDPANTDKTTCPQLTHNTMSWSKWSFEHAGRGLTWTRTHKKEFGASRWSDKDYKLVDDVSEAVLAVWVNGGSSCFKKGPAARLDFYAELDRELELLSLTAIMGIEASLRRADQAAAASA